ncbi:MAG: DUF1015 domain-containing protein [Christensenellaceae bacterium]|nr:DUF1015 domain-containing protein [Christensenellaceae bacterium]
MDWNKLGIYPANFLLPKDNINMEKWAVVACDQYTQDLNYWESLKEFVGDNPSTLNLILPEVYLNKRKDYKEQIWRNMENYLNNGILSKEINNSFILLQRQVKNKVKLGLLCVCDLEQYGAAEDKPLIQSTEEVVLERIPPRLEIREKAPLELSHVMVLFDDKNKTVIEPLNAKADSLDVLYDYGLNKNGGHIKAFKVDKTEDLEHIYNSLTALKNSNKRGFLYGVGDGNHSLKVAQAHWNNIKANLSPEQRENHPARFATIELCNIHDDALVFEPIYRVIYNAEPERFINELSKYLPISLKQSGEDDIIIKFADKQLYIPYDYASRLLPVAVLQRVLDQILSTSRALKIDYIHGLEEIKQLSKSNIGFILPDIDKSSLFDTVHKLGVLPRKTFSMGSANEKRYYVECRKIM